MLPSEQQVKAELEAEGWSVYHYGLPDFLCLKDGKIKFIEVKTNTNIVTPAQKTVIEALKLHGFDISIVRRLPGKRVEAIVPDELENRFRAKAERKFGLRKGSLAKAIEAAIDQWVKQP